MARRGKGFHAAGKMAAGGVSRLSAFFPRLNWRRMATIVRKELLVLLCNRISRILIIVPPLMQIVIFGWAATMEVRNVDVAVLNYDSGRWSRDIIHSIEGSPTFRGVTHLEGHGQIRPTLDQQKALFILVFDEEFSRRIEKGEPAEAQVILDGRRSNAAQIAAYYLERMTAQVAAATPRAQTMQGMAAPIPQLDMRMRCWFNPNLEFQWFFLPNLIGMLSFMLGLVVTGLSVAREREVGTFDQLLVSPAIPTEIALAKLVPGCLVGMVHGTIFLLISVFGFGVPFTGSVLLLYVAMLVFAAASGGVGLMVSSLSATQQQAFLGAFTVGVPCILITYGIFRTFKKWK
ncbi:MAG: putative multidrug ABC transporter permease YbhR [Desulfovibrio sp.]